MSALTAGAFYLLHQWLEHRPTQWLHILGTYDEMLELELRETADPGSCHLPCKKAVRVYLQKDAGDNLGILLLAADETIWGIRIISTMVRKSSRIEVRPRKQGTKSSSWKGNYGESSFTGISDMNPNLKGSSTVRPLLLQFLIVRLETSLCSAAQVGSKLMTSLPQPPKCWDFRCATTHAISKVFQLIN